jgi:hypothetical protein
VGLLSERYSDERRRGAVAASEVSARVAVDAGLRHALEVCVGAGFAAQPHVHTQTCEREWSSVTVGAVIVVVVRPPWAEKPLVGA